MRWRVRKLSGRKGALKSKCHQSVQSSVFHEMNPQPSLGEAVSAWNVLMVNWRAFLLPTTYLPVHGESLSKGPKGPSQALHIPIYTSFFVTGRSNCQRALDRCGAGKQGEVFTIKYPARIYGKPAQNPSQSPTQVLKPLTLLC